MSGTVNKVILVGRLGKDPELKYTPSGVPVAKFSLATDESFKDKTGAKQSRTEWHNITAWNKLAEICGQYLKKGGLVYLEGSIKSHQWQDQAGAKRSATEIVINQMQMLGGKPQSGEDAAAQAAVHDTTPPPAGTDPVPEAGFVDEEIPF